MTGRSDALARLPELAELSRAQHGVVRRDQLVALGVTRDHVRHQIQARRWRPIGAVVVVLHTGPLTRAAWRWAAVTHAGEGSLLAGLTALEERGLRGWTRSDAHVLVRYGASVVPLPGLVAHRTRRMPVRRASPEPGCPATSAARAAVDAARWSCSPRTAAGIVTAVVQQRLATAEEVEQCLDELGSTKQARVIRSTLVDVQDGAESLAEGDVARLVVRAGLPRPRRQVAIHTPEGVRRVDLVVDLPDGRLLVLEVDGPHHDDPTVRRADSVKDAALVALGHLVLRIPGASVRLEPYVVQRQLEAIKDGIRRV